MWTDVCFNTFLCPDLNSHGLRSVGSTLVYKKWIGRISIASQLFAVAVTSPMATCVEWAEATLTPPLPASLVERVKRCGILSSSISLWESLLLLLPLSVLHSTCAEGPPLGAVVNRSGSCH